MSKGPEGYSVNLALQMLHRAMRDEEPVIGGLVVKYAIKKFSDDNMKTQRHLAIDAYVQSSPPYKLRRIEVECWLQHGGHYYWYGQIIVPVLHNDGSQSQGFKRFYRYSDLTGLERIESQRLVIEPSPEGGFLAFILGGLEVAEGDTRETAAGKLIFAHPEVLGLVVVNK